MSQLPLGLIVAMAANRCIGKDGGLPWRVPEDLKHFRRTTTGHAILMGRKTHESIGRPLPKRRNIVISRRPGLRIEGCEVVHSLAEAITRARETDPMPIVIGGAAIYEAALPQVTRIWMTHIDRTVDGDTFFPPLDPADWREIARTPGETEDVTFLELDRASPPR